MLKKIGTVFLVLVFVFIFGFLSGSGKLNNISQVYLNTEVVVKADCGQQLSCPAGQALCDVSHRSCHGDCVKAWGRCCDFCAPGNTCDDGHYGAIEDCSASGKSCVNGSCVDPQNCTPTCIPWNASTDSCGNPVVRCPISCSGLSRTFYCVNFECSNKGGVEAERCDDGAVAWENGGGASGSHNIQDGKVYYEAEDKWLPKHCFVSQTDYYESFNDNTPNWGSYKGHSMGNRSVALEDCLAVTPTPPQPPSATHKAACNPSENNENRHRFLISDISGGNGQVEETTLFLSFDSTKNSDNQIKEFLGIPTWAEGSWFGYWIEQKKDLGGVNQIEFFVDNVNTIYDKNKDGDTPITPKRRSWLDLAHYLEENAGASGSNIPSNYLLTVDATIKIGNVDRISSLGGAKIPLRTYTCTSPPPDPQCNKIKMLESDGPGSIDDFSDLKPGQEVIFRCESNDPAMMIEQFQYRAIIDGEEEMIGFVQGHSEGGISASWSPVVKLQSGDYIVQCRVCNGTDESTCADWERIP